MAEIMAHDMFRRITRNGGNIYVSVEADKNEHPSTVRADALRYVREHLGADYHICAWLGWEHYRRSDGYPASARRFSVVRIPR